MSNNKSSNIKILSPLCKAMGLTTLLFTNSANAAVAGFTWTGVFTMLNGVGTPLVNPDVPGRGANQYQTPVAGTMAFDTISGAGTATLNDFAFFGSTFPAQAVGINMQAIGDGMGGAGALVLGNMLFNWGGSYGIPVSIVMDATGFFTATNADFADGTLDNTDSSVINFGATPSSDGSYTNVTFGYLNQGPLPMVTTDWNLTVRSDCGLDGSSTDYITGTGCMNNPSSGVLPLVTDNAVNVSKAPYDASYVGTGTGIGGVPMWDGPFTGFNANFDISSMTIANDGVPLFITAFDVGPEVPVPATIWLFGSGLLGLIGVARRKTAEVGVYK